MIELKVEPYCQNCPEFCADVSRFYSDEKVYLTLITCEHTDICKEIKKHLREELNNALAKMANNQ